MGKKLIFTLIFSIFLSISLNAQWNIGITIGGLAVHQKKESTLDLYPWKLDRNGYVIAFAGINLSVSYRVNNYIGIKAVQSLIFHDSGGKFAGISHIGIQMHDDLVGMKNPDHQFSMSIGPFWYYRKNWNEISGYKNDPSFISLSDNMIWEKKFVWYGGFFRYDYHIKEDLNLAIDFLPGYPFVYAATTGLSSNYHFR